MLHFKELEHKYGYVIAHSLLMDLERHAQLNSAELAAVDPELRLQNAVHLMDNKQIDAQSVA